MNERLRIGDAERETAARELGEHFALGRIDAEEHAERLEQIMTARTGAELAPAFRDLPRGAAERTQRPEAARPSRRPERPRSGRGLPRMPFVVKLGLTALVLWWGFHHFLFLMLALLVYVVVVRRLTRRRRAQRWQHRVQRWQSWHGWDGWDGWETSGSQHGRKGGYQTGWH